MLEQQKWFWTASWEVVISTQMHCSECSLSPRVPWLWLPAVLVCTDQLPSCSLQSVPLASLCWCNLGKARFWILGVQQALQGCSQARAVFVCAHSCMWCMFWTGSSSSPLWCDCSGLSTDSCLLVLAAAIWIIFRVMDDSVVVRARETLPGCATEPWQCHCVPRTALVCDCCVLGRVENPGPGNRILWKSCFILGGDQSRLLAWESQGGF